MVAFRKGFAMRLIHVLGGVLLICAWASGQTTAPDSAGGAIELYARGQYEAVVARLAPAFAAGQAGIQDRLLLARACLHLGRGEQAADVLESVLKTDGENPEANSLRGQQLLAASQPTGAVKFLDRAYKLRKTPAVASLLGQAHFQLGNRVQAKEYLEAALAEDIRNPANSFTLGKMCLADGAGAQAEKFLLLAQDAGLESAELHHLLGQAYLLQRKFVGPVMIRRLARPAKVGDIVDEQVVLRSIEGRPDECLVCTRYCALYEGLWLIRTAAAEGRRPGDAAFARVPASQAESAAAVSAIASLALPPQSIMADAQFMAAKGWFAAGQYGLSKQSLEKSRRLAPSLTRTAELEAQIAIATADWAGLRETLGQKDKFEPATVADFYYKAAIVLRAEGKHAEALAALKKADAAVPTSAPVLRALAGLSLATGDRQAARKYYARIIELFPDADDIQELHNAHRNLSENAGDAQ